MRDNISATVLVLTGLLVIAGLLSGHYISIQLRRSLLEQKQLFDTLKNDVCALFTGAVGVDARIHKLETRTRRIIERQEQLENNKHSERPYEQAIRMVQKGSSLEDIISVCNLSKGEADLIMMVHGQQADQQQGNQMH